MEQPEKNKYFEELLSSNDLDGLSTEVLQALKDYANKYKGEYSERFR